MGGGERERRVVATQFGQQRAGRGDRGREGRPASACADRPAEQCRRDLDRRRVAGRLISRTRPRTTRSGTPSPASAARARAAGPRSASRAGARSAAPGTADRAGARRRPPAGARGWSGRGRPGSCRRRASDRTARSSRTVSSAASGARTRRPDAAGPRADRLGEALAVVLDEPDRPLDHRARTAVVDLEVDPPKPGQSAPRAPGSAGRRRAASRRSTGRRRRPGRSLFAGAASRSARSSCSAVDVLGLVDQQRRGARPPAGEQHRVRRQAADRPDDEVVEVDATRRADRALVCRRRPARSGRARDRRRPRRPSPAGPASASRTRGRGGRASAATPPGTASRSSSSRSISGSTATPASTRISRPSAWNVRTRTAPAATPSGASAASSRSVSSSAARLLKATTVIVPGSTPPSTSQATRATRVVVLPLPAGATTRTGPRARSRPRAGRAPVAPAARRRRDGTSSDVKSCDHRPLVGSCRCAFAHHASGIPAV